MSWFQLDAESIARRATAVEAVGELPTLARSILRGVIGFTIVSVAGFVPWAVFGRWFNRTVGELGMYVACAVVFVGLSGPLLHRLILGAGSCGRFYKLFGLSFTVYSVGWIAGWFAFRGHVGSLVGLLAGTAAMGWMIARAFGSPESTLKVIAVLFLLNTAGYFVGGWVEGGVMGLKELNLAGTTVGKRTQARIAMLLWGVFYGIGFGAGLGWAFHLVQRRARELIRASRLSSEPV